MAEAVDDIVYNPENNLETMRALREENVDHSNGVSYRNGSFYKGDMEVVSDELPDEEEPDEPIKLNTNRTIDNPISTKKKFIVTADGLGQIVIEADTRKSAMAKYRKQYGNDYVVICVSEY